MEVGTEISQKIRSAIKAKLMELGAYVDDELPDYIMVMVANKKTPAQMSSDLGLFLGGNTDTFTEWLHGLLGKLQTITVDSNKAGDKHGKSKGSKEKKKDKSQKTDKKDSSKEKKKGSRRNSDGVAKKRATSSSSDKISEAKSNSEELQTDSQVIFQKSKDSVVKEVHKGSVEEVEDVRQLLVTETPADELAKELETTETEMEQVRTVKQVPEKSQSKPSSVLSKVKDVGADSPTNRSRSSSPDGHSVQTSSHKKRKAPVSVVANININRKEENEEEYDPFNPAVGSVASVVKVTSRKSSVPPAMQANRDSNDTELEGKESAEDRSNTSPDEPPSKLRKLSGAAPLENIKEVLTDIIKKAREEEDHISHFAKMVESTMRKLRPQDISLAKLRVQQVLYQFESMSSNPSNHSGTGDADLSISLTSSDSYPGNEVTNKEKVNSSGKFSKIQKLSATTNTSRSKSAMHNMYVSSVSGPQNNQRTTEDNKDNNENVQKSDLERSSTPGKDGGVTRIIFRPKQTQSKKRPRSSSYSHDSSTKTENDRDRRLTESEQDDQKPQSPVSSSKVDSLGSPSSVHSCPSSSNPGFNPLILRKCIVSTSNRAAGSTHYPDDTGLAKSLSSIDQLKTEEVKHRSLPSISVDSIHVKRRLESDATPPVLKQNWERDSSLPGTSQPMDIEDNVDSPRPISSEALKVLAKNLKVTVINKRATSSHQGSSSEDSSSEETDDDSSDEDDDEEEGEQEEDENLKEKQDGETAVEDK